MPGLVWGAQVRQARGSRMLPLDAHLGAGEVPAVGPVEVLGPALVVCMYQFVHDGVFELRGIALEVVVAQLQLMPQVPPEVPGLTLGHHYFILWEVTSSLYSGTVVAIDHGLPRRMNSHQAGHSPPTSCGMYTDR